MKQISETMYAQEESDGGLLLHRHGPEGTPWCLVNTLDETGTPKTTLIAMFVELETALMFAEFLAGVECALRGGVAERGVPRDTAQSVSGRASLD